MFVQYVKWSKMNNHVILSQGSLSKKLQVEARITLQPSNTREGVNDGKTYLIQLTQDLKDITVTQPGTTKRIGLEDLCPEDSDCGQFLLSVKFFLLELGGTFAGLSWGAWSTVAFAINQVNSEQ
jgi:hypothetical protein